MRALIDGTPLSAGGGVQVAIALLLNLQRHSPIEWLTALPCSLRNALPEELLAEERIILLPKRRRRDCLTLGWKLREMEKHFRPDMVFTIFGPAYFSARAPHLIGFALPHLLYNEEKPAVASRSERFIDRFRRRALRRADQIVVETQTVKDRLASLLGIDPAKIAVIANGLNPVFRNYRQGENETDGCTRILVPSAYYPHKNLEIIPEVAAAIRKADPGLGFQFQLTLDPESQPWRALHRKTMALDAQNFVTTLGVLTLDDLARAYQKAAAVFLPTLREASTSVYPESFYFRRPLVTSDRDFARELCGDAALFIPPRDADAIAHCLIKLLRSPDLGKGLAEAGERQLARRYPDPDTKFAMQLELMMQVACQGKRTRFHVNAGSTEGDDGFRQYRSGWNRSEIGRG